MVTAMGRQIKIEERMSDKENQEELSKYMPKFMWVLRDFTLNIEDHNRNKI